uniref:LysM peptidoglycan-binding domain-containing protein n=1 Tax=uncultured Draconibacterium sp. TaxID=1573823 RepID=UPI0032164578
MKFVKLHNHSGIVICIVLLLNLFPYVVKANADTIPGNFDREFKSNLAALTYPESRIDSAEYRGTFSFNDKVDFEKEIQGNTLFSEFRGKSTTWFRYLNELPYTDKQNLVKGFSYYGVLLERELNAAGLPENLKYLAPVLSAMNTRAVGKNSRAGIWQLTHFQGILNGLQVNRLVDERLNPEMATKALVLQLQKNSTLFKSTELAVLAYLAGNTKLINVMRRCGENPTVNEVLQYMPEVSETIAAFQAMAVFLRVNTFNPDSVPVLPDLVEVNKQIHFRQVAGVLNIPETQLQFLNPQYPYSIVPGDEKSMTLRIPAEKRDEFTLLADSIYSTCDSTLFQVVAQKIEYPPAPNRQYVGEKVKDLEIEGKTKIKYTIKSGDVLGFIAEEYNVRVADLKYWNNIYNERRIQAGKSLDIFVDNEDADYYLGLQKKTEKPAPSKNIVAQLTGSSPIPVYQVPESSQKVEHVVKSGESPYVIAKKYTGVTPEAILEWNGITDARKIQIGQKLIIYLTQ